MKENEEHKFAEIVFEQVVLENLPEKQSAYFQSEDDAAHKQRLLQFESKLKWHIQNSLSQRQREVMNLILSGKTEREIAVILGVTQQVVHIYKWRAIHKLRERIAR